MLDLSIVIITYNRCSFLDKTLSQLANSPFCECPIWILNNASTDATLDVCKAWSSIFPCFHVITHKFNIGADANILRAYEYGDSYYKWILCDDDELNFDCVDDLLDVIRNKRYDLIRVTTVNVPGVITAERGTCRTLGSLLEDKKSLSFFSFGFVPGIIFRSSLVNSQVKYGYLHLYTRYSQLFVLLRSFNPQTQVYTTAHVIIVRGSAESSSIFGFEIYTYWLQSLKALPTKSSVNVAIGCIFPQNGLFRLGRSILGDIKNFRPKRDILLIWKDAFLLAPTIKARLIFLLNLPFIIIPRWIIKIVYSPLTGKPFIERDIEEIIKSRE